MDIKITITHALSPALETIITKLLSAAIGEIAAEQPTPAVDAPAPKRRKSAPAEPAPGPQLAPAPASPMVVPQPEPPKVAKLTRDDLAALMERAVVVIKTSGVREALKSVGAARLQEIPEDRYPAFAKALHDAMELVS